MHRYKLILEYDGGPFAGWQRQENGRAVQQALEEAAERLCGEKVVAHAAGRTDAGVHALGMAAHIDLPRAYPENKVRDALNAHLRPEPVAVLAAHAVGEDFHARFSCIRRSYLYRISTRRAPLVLERGRVWRTGGLLDAAAMHDAAQALVGQHDFTTFRASQCQAKSPVKTLEKISVVQAGDEVHVTCAARSFLHNQVRSIVGTLERVGAGRMTRADVAGALAARDRAACGPVAPPDGLYFMCADYPA